MAGGRGCVKWGSNRFGGTPAIDSGGHYGYPKVKNRYQLEAVVETAPRLRMTAQRQVILEELRKLKSHPTAGELCQIVRTRLPRISLGTVYRNLEILSRVGAIQKIDVSGVEMRFDGTVDNHYHLRCVECGRVHDVEMPILAGLEQSVGEISNFEVLGHRLEFVGRCPACRETAAALS